MGGAGAGAVSMDEHPHGTENVSTFSISLYPMRNWKKLRAAHPARIAILARVSRQSVSQTPHFLRSSGLKLLSRDEARRIVSKIVKLPGLLRKL
jgi:hypothetical protein